MSVQFKKRLFGAEIDDSIQKELRRIGGGGIKVDPLGSVDPTFETYSLGEKTPFARMWCAVSVNEWHQDTWEKYNGERVFRNSNGQWFYFLNDDQNSEEKPILGNDKNAKRFVFSINEHRDQIDNYKFSSGGSSTTSALDSVAGAEVSTNLIKYIKQLSHNPHMKPFAGITSVRAKTQGAVGAIISATVEFVVHNRFDFETIFLPFFLRPGSIVCLDYGWSDVTLYEIMDRLDKEDTDMSTLDNFLYNENNGWVTTNYGKANTLVGNVVSYDVSVNTDGGYQCSLELVSRNAGLLEKKVEGDLRNLFVNSMNDVLAAVLVKSYGINKGFSLDHLRKNLTSADPIDTRDIAKRFISELSDVKKLNEAKKKNEFITGTIPLEAVKRGIFHQDMAPNLTFSDQDLSTRVQDIKTAKAKTASELRQTIVKDEVLSKERTYISYGLFEDLFLNNFAKATIVGKQEIDTSDDAGLSPRAFIKDIDTDFENKFDTRRVLIRWHKSLVKYQKAELQPNDSLPIFMIPDNWDQSYNSLKLQQHDDEKSYVKMKVTTEEATTGAHPNYPGVNVMPLRDLFISVNAIQTAFENNGTVNDSLAAIYDEINAESGQILNIKLFSDSSSNIITAQDIHLQPVETSRFIFDVTGPESLVSSMDLKYSTPKDGLASMLAIGNMSGPQSFSDIDLSQFSYLTLLNQSSDPQVPPLIRSLPSQGNINRFTSQEDGLTLSLSGVNQFINDYEAISDSPPTKAQQKLEFYYASLQQKGLGEEEENITDANYNAFETSKAYQYKVQRSSVYESDRAIIKQELRETIYDQEGDGTVSPILPIELSLSIYGNTYLQIGDKFSVNYLPKFYENRVHFQIVGLEDVIDPNGWTTTYESIMRVEPNKKSLVTGKKKLTNPAKYINPATFLRSKTTSVIRVLGTEVPAQVIAGIDEISKLKQPKTEILVNQDIDTKYKLSGLKYRLLQTEIEAFDVWNGKVERTEIEGFIRKTTKDYTPYLKYDYTSISSLKELKILRQFAYALAVRKLLFGANSPINFELANPLFVSDVTKSNEIDEFITNGYKKNNNMLVILDKIPTTFGIEDDIRDFIKDDSVFRSIDKDDFELNSDLRNFKYFEKKVLDNEDFEFEKLRYKTTSLKGGASFHVPLLPLSIFFGTNTEKAKSETSFITTYENKADILPFKYLTIPNYLLRASEVEVITQLMDYHIEYSKIFKLRDPAELYENGG